MAPPLENPAESKEAKTWLSSRNAFYVTESLKSIASKLNGADSESN